jgi:hypothetical protein
MHDEECQHAFDMDDIEPFCYDNVLRGFPHTSVLLGWVRIKCEDSGWNGCK